ncbi:MAG: anaerobic sulfatase maturase, partial [Clostridia bacterium]|nr:anaerobic sulfatase maturase [Clostridia bacterium]
MYLLIKPASGACNLRCRYCFYSDEMENREHAVRRFMSPGDFRVIAEKAIARESAPDGSGSVSFGFQGGEP